MANVFNYNYFLYCFNRFIISFIEALRVNHILPNLDKIINEYDKKA
jgi:hypothetical protein